MDRNERARQEFAAKSQQRQINQLMQSFAQAMASGQAAVRDRFGNTVEDGVRVLFRPPYDYIYNVVDVAPVLDPNTPPGMAKVRLTIDTLVQLPVNQATPGMIVVGRWKAAGAAAGLPGSEQTSQVAEPILPPPVGDGEHEHEHAHPVAAIEAVEAPDTQASTQTDGDHGERG